MILMPKQLKCIYQICLVGIAYAMPTGLLNIKYSSTGICWLNPPNRNLNVVSVTDESVQLSWLNPFSLVHEYEIVYKRQGQSQGQKKTIRAKLDTLDQSQNDNFAFKYTVYYILAFVMEVFKFSTRDSLWKKGNLGKYFLSIKKHFCKSIPSV